MVGAIPRRGGGGGGGFGVGRKGVNGEWRGGLGRDWAVFRE